MKTHLLSSFNRIHWGETIDENDVEDAHETHVVMNMNSDMTSSFAGESSFKHGYILFARKQKKWWSVSADRLKRMLNIRLRFSTKETAAVRSKVRQLMYRFLHTARAPKAERTRLLLCSDCQRFDSLKPYLAVTNAAHLSVAAALITTGQKRGRLQTTSTQIFVTSFSTQCNCYLYSVAFLPRKYCLLEGHGRSGSAEDETEAVIERLMWTKWKL